MSIPNHEVACISNALKTNCPKCNESVWSLSCNCESPDYYEYFGWPWIKHECKSAEITIALDTLKNCDRLTEEELENYLNNFKNNNQLSKGITDILDYELGKRIYQFTYSEISCSENQLSITGMLMQINSEVNFYDIFGIDKDSLLAEGLLGSIAMHKYDEFIIRENPDLNNHSKQYRIYAEHNKFENPERFSNILASVSVLEIPCGKIWIADEIKIFK